MSSQPPFKEQLIFLDVMLSGNKILASSFFIVLVSGGLFVLFDGLRRGRESAPAESEVVPIESIYYARVADGIVTNVLLSDSESIKQFSDGSNAEWIITMQNTIGGVHYDPDTMEPDGKEALRKNTAVVGYSYDKNLDAFIPPQPYDSWILNEETCLWEPPIPYPANRRGYKWNEQKKNWDRVGVLEIRKKG